MKHTNKVKEQEGDQGGEAEGTELLLPLLFRQAAGAATTASPGVVIGQMIAMRDQGRTPLVLYPGQTGSSAVAARSIVDLHAAHVGKHVLLLFENSDPAKPIIIGVMRGGHGWPLAEQPGQVEVQADGDRLMVSARDQLVLQCGMASITLTKSGKVLIQGTFVSSRSSGVNRIKGGSVQIN